METSRIRRPASSCRRPTDRDRWSAVGKELAGAKQAAEARKKTARGDFERWLAAGAAKSLAAAVPGEGLRLHVPLSEGRGDVVRALLDGQPRTFKPTAEIAWDPGHVAKESFTPRARVTLEIPEAGDFEHHQAFSYGVWARLSQPGQTGALLARMDDQHGFRGWDLWLENDRLATHLIHQWPDDALKVISNAAVTPGRWHHLLVSYDGSRLAAGVKIYVDGQLQQTSVAAQSLKNTIRTSVPLSVAQRHTSEPAGERRSARPADLRTRAAGRGSGAAHAQHAGRVVGRQAGRRALPGRETGVVRLVAAGARQTFWRTDGARGRFGARAGPAEIAGEHGAGDAGAERGADGVRAVSRRVRQASGRGDSGDARLFAAHACRLRRRTGWASPAGCCVPTIR